MPVASDSACNQTSTSPQTPSNGSLRVRQCRGSRTRAASVGRASPWRQSLGNVARNLLRLSPDRIAPSLPVKSLKPGPTGLLGWHATRELGPVRPGTGWAGPHLIPGCIMLDQPIAERGRWTVTLDVDASVPGLVGQLERGLEDVHVKAQHPLELRRGLPCDLTRATVTADEAPHQRVILLLDPSLIVAAARSGTGEGNASIGAVPDHRLVDEHAVVVQVDAADGER